MEKLSMLTDDDYAKANQSYSLIRELKVELTFAYGGVINHEIYFGHLGGKGGEPTSDLLKQLKKDFGKCKKKASRRGKRRPAFKRAFNYSYCGADRYITFPRSRAYARRKSGNWARLRAIRFCEYSQENEWGSQKNAEAKRRASKLFFEYART